VPFGMGPWGWFQAPYAYPYWGWGRCRWFPWLPRRWWTGMYGPITPYTTTPYTAPYWGTPTITKEQEIAMLEDQAKIFERELEQIRKRLKEFK